MTNFELSAPLFFLLLPVPIIVWFLSNYLPTPVTGLLIPTAFLQKFNSDVQDQSGIHLSWRLVALSISWFGIIIGLTNPRIPDTITALPISGRDIILAIDLSGSMAKHDFELNGTSLSRLDLVKHVASELIERRQGDRIGLVIFAEKTYAASPLSFDVQAVANTLKELEIGLVGRSTAIGEGLGLSLKKLMTSAAPSRIVILLSDGANNAGSSQPTAVAELSRQLGIKIFTIGLGEDNPQLLSDPRDAVDFITLQNVAQIGGGTAVMARSGADLDRAMHMIEEMIVGPEPAPPRIIYHELWIYPVSLSFIILFFIALASRALK